MDTLLVSLVSALHWLKLFAWRGSWPSAAQSPAVMRIGVAAAELLTNACCHGILFVDNRYLLLWIIYYLQSMRNRVAEMSDQSARLLSLIDRLRERGYRITPQRRAVIEVLLHSDDHPGVGLIYERVRERFPMTRLSTVYKTISLLRDVGEIHEIGFSDDTNRYDAGKTQPHAHIICTRCNQVNDLDIEMSGNRLRMEIAQDTGYDIQWERHDFFGICPNCKDSPQPRMKETQQ